MGQLPQFLPAQPEPTCKRLLPCLPVLAVGESYQISFAEYKAQYTEDAGGAMLDKDAIAAVKGVKVRRWLLGVLPVGVWRGCLQFGLPRTMMPLPPSRA